MTPLIQQVSRAVILVGALLAGASAQAQANLITNGSFESTTMAAGGKVPVSNSNLTGWRTLGPWNTLASPGTAANGYHFAFVGDAFSIYGPFAATSPNGGNFIMSDGDTANGGSSIYQTLTGLTPDQTYVLTFYQAAGQAIDYSGATVSRWEVSFTPGTTPTTTQTASPNGTTTQLSEAMNAPSHGTVGWNLQQMSFVATSATQTLTFLSYGTPGGHPSVSLLDGVTITAVPEPASWALLLAGLAGLGFMARRRRG